MSDSGMTFLRPVPEAAPSDHGEPKTERANMRPRARRILPTDRLKHEQQVKALKAYPIVSNYGAQAVGSDDIATFVGVTAATAGLNNAFFADAGLIIRQSKGKYVPSEIVNEFAREHTFDPKAAAKLLAPSFEKMWYFEVVAQCDEMGPMTRDSLVRALAHRAGATADHAGHLGSIIDWLEFAGLIEVDGNSVLILPKDREHVLASASDSDMENEPDRPKIQGLAPDPLPVKDRSDAVLAFSFEFAVTAGDLSRLSPDQIRALFDAAGAIMAIKATVSERSIDK